MEKTQELLYTAPELHRDGSLPVHSFVARGSPETGWRIERDGLWFLDLSSGFVPVRPLVCGICSTDLARHLLPHPLPQVVGHEAVVEDLPTGRLCVVGINASEKDRGIPKEQWCEYCRRGMTSQCSQRMTFGIDRLPGGFAPLALVPRGCLVPVPSRFSIRVASLTEPFAAALHGVCATPPLSGETIGVLGTGRLGLLTIAALAAWRRTTHVDFLFTALSRHAHLRDLALTLGADHAVDPTSTLSFDMVFDTTGTADGFEVALRMARRILHVKSTCGQRVCGLCHLTEMVVEEITLLPCTLDALEFCWPLERTSGTLRTNNEIYVAPSVPESVVQWMKEKQPNSQRQFHRKDPQDAPLGCFDLALLTSVQEIDQVLRPQDGVEKSLVRARGAIVVCSSDDDDNNKNNSNALLAALQRTQYPLSIHSSRCGDMEEALKLLEANPSLCDLLETQFITHTFPLEQIREAFATAVDRAQSIKILVEIGKHDEGAC